MPTATEFLGCLSLRNGTIFSIWWTILSNLFLFGVNCRYNFFGSISFAIFHFGYFLFGVVIAAAALWKFPARNVLSYAVWSPTAEFLSLLSGYHNFTVYMATAGIGIVTYKKFRYVLDYTKGHEKIWDIINETFHSGNYFYEFFLPGALWIVFHVHTAAVIRGYYLEITEHASAILMIPQILRVHEQMSRRM